MISRAFHTLLLFFSQPRSRALPFPVPTIFFSFFIIISPFSSPLPPPPPPLLIFLHILYFHYYSTFSIYILDPALPSSFIFYSWLSSPRMFYLDFTLSPHHLLPSILFTFLPYFSSFPLYLLFSTAPSAFVPASLFLLLRHRLRLNFFYFPSPPPLPDTFHSAKTTNKLIK